MTLPSYLGQEKCFTLFDVWIYRAFSPCSSLWFWNLPAQPSFQICFFTIISWLGSTSFPSCKDCTVSNLIALLNSYWFYRSYGIRLSAWSQVIFVIIVRKIHWRWSGSAWIWSAGSISKKKGRNVLCWNAWCSLLKAWGFSFIFDVHCWGLALNMHELLK
jgi:hypothetical protein